MLSEDDPEYKLKKDNFKFKFGDYVRIVPNKESEDAYKILNFDTIFQISRIDDKYIHHYSDNFKREGVYYYLNFFSKNGSNNPYGWVIENDLELVPDYELDAMKYNL